MTKHWDIKKPYKTRTTRRKQVAHIYPPKYKPIGRVEIAPHPEICLHKQCNACQLGLCSGIHMISCPCHSCSPRFRTIKPGTVYGGNLGIVTLSESYSLGRIRE